MATILNHIMPLLHVKVLSSSGTYKLHVIQYFKVYEIEYQNLNLFLIMVQSLYKTPHYKTDWDKTLSCDSHMFLPHNFTKEL